MDSVRRIIALCAFLSAVSCSSYRNLTPPPQEILPTIKPKNKVAVLLTDGTEIKSMKVTAITPDSISGSYVIKNRRTTGTVANSAIKGIQKRKDAKGRTLHLSVLVPGSIARITLTSGERIEDLKVTSVDAGMIEGTQMERTKVGTIGEDGKPNYQMIRKHRLIKMDDVATIQLKVHDPTKTTLLVIACITVPIGVFLIAWAQAMSQI